ncbi:MAG TPA: insulinase family protein [bacterium]|nr:insulinase family protein [bacterium]HPN43237.1 insulinase family protein [bacterium]
MKKTPLARLHQMYFMVFFISLFYFNSASASDPMLLKPDDMIPVDSSVTIGQFVNGLKYYIKTNARPEKRAQLHLVVNVGSILEDDDQQGLAHFAEHMAFNGTKNFHKQQLIDYLESIGMQFGPEINASTGFDETIYMLQLPTDNDEILEKGFQILEDWAHQVSYEPIEIDRERGIIIEEWRLGRGAGQRIFDKQLPILFKDSQYANRLPIGKKAILESFPHETLQRFYREWYRPDLMAVIAVGDFDKSRIQALIEQHFAGLSNPAPVRERTIYPVPDNTEPLFAIAADPEATETAVSIYFKYDLVPHITVADYRQGLIEDLYNAMMNNRLQELLQQADPPFLNAYSGNGYLVRSKGAYFLNATVKETGIQRGLQTVLVEALRVKQYGFTATELERMKKEILRYMERALKERDKTESIAYAREFSRNFLRNETIPGIEYEYRLANQFMEGIQLDEVNKLAEQWLTDKNQVILVDAPEKPTLVIPTEEDLKAVIASVDTLTLTPWVDRVSSQPLIAELPAPGTVVSEKKVEPVGLTIWQLSNGIKVICKPTEFKNDEVRFNAYSYGGNSLAPDSSYIAALTATDVVTDGGVGEFDFIELPKILAGKVVSVTPWISTTAEGIGGQASPQDIETMFQLIYLYFTAPRIDTTAYQAYITRLKGYLENRNVRPESAFQDTLQVTLANYHFRARPWSLGLLNEMNLDKSFAFYRERFADADDFTFFFVGNFDLQVVKLLAAQYLASLPTLPRQESWRDPAIHFPQGTIAKTIYKGIEPKSRVGLVICGNYKWSMQNVYDIESLTDLLRIKLREVLREDMSGTYGVNVGNTASRLPREEYRFSISFGCAPERVNELTEMVYSQIDSIATYGPADEYVEKIRETQSRQLEVDLKENRFWLANLMSFEQNKINYEDILNRQNYINRLTSKTLQKAAKKYLCSKNTICVILAPQNDSTKKE